MIAATPSSAGFEPTQLLSAGIGPAGVILMILAVLMLASFIYLLLTPDVLIDDPRDEERAQADGAGKDPGGREERAQEDRAREDPGIREESAEEVRARESPPVAGEREGRAGSGAPPGEAPAAPRRAAAGGKKRPAADLAGRKASD